MKFRAIEKNKNLGTGRDLSTPRLQWDARLGGQDRLLYVRSEELMQIPAEIQQCVAFIGPRKKKGEPEARGTVFFLSYPLDDRSEGAFETYAVTARHVIDEIGDRSDGNVYCRLNTRKHTAVWAPIPMSAWYLSENPQVDVAVAPLSDDWGDYAHRFVPLGMFATDELLTHHMVSSGEEVFFPGLFSNRPGDSANIPIVRTGTIAAMPSEPIQIGEGCLTPSYLLEARSIGGLSGSPVFLNLGGSRFARSDGTVSTGMLFYFLGLVHGHYTSLEAREINAGIAIVIPADAVRSVLDSDELEENREKRRRAISADKASSFPVPDSEPVRHIPGRIGEQESD